MRAAIYTRVSTSMQEDGFSLKAQKDILMQTIERKDLQLYRVYSDPGVSGKNLNRPGVQEMIEDMKIGRFDTLLVHKLDRLSRSMGDIISFIELVNNLNVRLIIAAQGQDEIDTRSPLGKAFLQFNGIWAELYLNNLREETLKGLVRKVSDGGQHISRPPLGYDFDEDKELIVNERESALVRKVFDLYTEVGWGVTKIAKHMNTFSNTKEGGKWDSKTVRNIITNHTYTGRNHLKPDHWPEEDRIVSDGTHQALIEQSQFDKAQGFRERRRAGLMSTRSFTYPYSGIVKCGICGANYTGNSSVHGDVKYLSYRCLNQYAKGTCKAPGISQRILNNLVFNHIQVLDDGYQKPKKKVSKINVDNEIEKSKKRRKNWMMALGDGVLSGDDYAKLVDEEDARLAKIRDVTKSDPLPLTPLPEIQKTISRLKEDWDFIEVETQKQIIQNTLQRVTIKKVSDKWEVIDMLTT